ncbi:hypothetical protein [Tardiphaga sp.]|uniref:hypothetical protein n=1 Tax=Tardiphaga sp. TaxID=1926292 RepID=UPI0025E578B0|nr:hypothetical protein [Tardiphaga sp.]
MTHPSRTYENYAESCLDIAAQTADRGARLLLREMAAEWLKVSDTDCARRRDKLSDGYAISPDGHALPPELSS